MRITIPVALASLLIANSIPVSSNAAVVDATWVSGSGDWTDGTLWTFSPANGFLYPNNSASDFFNVFIDGGQTGTTSSVTLNTWATIDSLSIDAGDSLEILEGIQLTVVRDDARPASGNITNNGNLRLSSSSAGANLAISGNVTLTGSGTVTLSDHINNRILASAAGNRLTNQSTIQGAGQIGANNMALTNEGLIVANQATELIINPLDGAGNAVNTGTLRGSGAGGLLLTGGSFDNQGTGGPGWQ